MRALGALLALTFVLAVPAFPQSESQKSSPVPGEIAGQVPTTGQVPDESVVPQWLATFEIVMKARETNFVSFRAPMPSRPSGPLSDEELINGIKSQPPHRPDIPRL